MTTIISNGKFLVADRRASFTHDKRVNMRLESGEHSPESRIDNIVKIFTTNPDLTLTNIRGNVVAFAVAGNSYTTAKLVDYLANYSGQVDLPAIVKAISYWFTPDGSEIIAITDQGYSLKFEIGAANTFEYAPGRLACIGSGSTFLVRFLIKYPEVAKKLSIEDLFILSAAMDPYTSSRYSVCSGEEKIIYPNCELDPIKARARVLEIMTEAMTGNRGFEIYDSSIIGL